jgi:hypothetical protein
MRLFLAAASNPGGRKNCLLLTAASLFLPRGAQFSSQKFIDSVGLPGVIDTGQKNLKA